MKKLITSLTVSSLLFMNGCSTLTPNQVTNYAAVAEVAAFTGTSVALKQHPEWRPGFIEASAELKTIANSTNITITQIMMIVQRLPVKELQSDTAKLTITSATILLSGLNVPEMPADRIKQLQPIVVSIYTGIDMGIGTL